MSILSQIRVSGHQSSQTACECEVSRDAGCLSLLPTSFSLYNPIKLYAVSTADENSTQPDIDLQRDETRELSSLQMQQEDASTCTSVISGELVTCSCKEVYACTLFCYTLYTKS